jgi:hypothetical protein
MSMTTNKPNQTLCQVLDAEIQASATKFRKYPLVDLLNAVDLDPHGVRDEAQRRQSLALNRLDAVKKELATLENILKVSYEAI